MANGLDLDMVTIPAGSFIMGAGEDDLGDDEWMPSRRIYLSEYQIQHRRVNVEEWFAFLSATGYSWPVPDYVDPAACDEVGITGVSYDDAMAFIAWLKNATHLPYCLPTEAQWEKAARGTAGQRYPWAAGDSIFGEDYDCDHQLKREEERESPFGVAGTCQGAEEWTSTYYGHWDLWALDPVDPRGPNYYGISSRTLRGRGLGWAPVISPCYRRSYNAVSARHPDYGFRVSIDPSKDPLAGEWVYHVGGRPGEQWGPPVPSPGYRMSIRSSEDPYAQYASLGLCDDADYLRLPVFRGERIGPSWNKFEAELLGLGIPDFALLRPGAFVIREQALDKIYRYIQNEVELLPVQIGGETWQVLNVTNVIDCIDREHSRYTFDRLGDKPVGIERFALHEEMLEGSYLFKLPPLQATEMFGTPALVELLETLGLSGLRTDDLLNIAGI